MQELYLIHVTACYKPWRYSSTTYTTNKKLFDFLDQNNDESMINELDWTKYLERDLEEDEEEDFDYYALFNEGSVTPIYPFIVLGETELYTQ